MSFRGSGLLRQAVQAPALRYRDFRYLWVSSAFNAAGFMGGQVVLGWLTLTLTDSPFMVGLVLGMRAAPMFFFGLVAGAIADMLDRRKLLRSLSLAMAAVSAGTAALLFLDALEVWHLFVLALVSGTLLAANQAAQQSYTWDIVGRGNLVGALALTSLAARLGGAGGSLAAGYLMDGVGFDAAYLAMAGAQLLSAGALTLARPKTDGAAVAVRRRVGVLDVWRGIREFGAEARHNHTLLILIILVGAVEVLGFSFQAVMPSIARDTLEVGPRGLGVMTAVNSLGAAAAVMVLSYRREGRRNGLAFMVVMLVFGGGLMILGLAATFPLALLAVAVIGASAALSDVFSLSMMQSLVPNELRGRAMGAWVVAVGTAPVGNMQLGALATLLGPGLALVSHGAALLVLGVGAASLLRRLRAI